MGHVRNFPPLEPNRLNNSGSMSANKSFTCCEVNFWLFNLQNGEEANMDEEDPFEAMFAEAAAGKADAAGPEPNAVIKEPIPAPEEEEEKEEDGQEDDKSESQQQSKREDEEKESEQQQTPAGATESDTFAREKAAMARKLAESEAGLQRALREVTTLQLEKQKRVEMEEAAKRKQDAAKLPSPPAPASSWTSASAWSFPTCCKVDRTCSSTRECGGGWGPSGCSPEKKRRVIDP